MQENLDVFKVALSEVNKVAFPALDSGKSAVHIVNAIIASAKPTSLIYSSADSPEVLFGNLDRIHTPHHATPIGEREGLVAISKVRHMVAVLTLTPNENHLRL